MDTTPFPFLDLPKDLRLMVYDHLIMRNYHKITMRIRGEEASVTLVRQEPIPPIHVACKLLLDEAGTYLRRKVERMSVGRATPRLIVHMGPFDALCGTDGLLERVAIAIDLYRFWRTLEPSKFQALSTIRIEGLDPEPSDADRVALQNFVRDTAEYMRKVNVRALSWHCQAEKILEGQLGFQYGLMSAGERVKAYIEVAQKLMNAPGAASEALHISILGDISGSDGFKTLAFLQKLSMICEIGCLNVYIHTNGTEAEEVNFTDRVGHVCYRGAISPKVWAEEWA
jgi:hypothetical protein